MKKRYMLTLTEETVNAIHADLKALNLRKDAMSGLIDDWLWRFQPTLHKMATKKQAGEQLSMDEIIGDLFGEMGKAMRGE